MFRVMAGLTLVSGLAGLAWGSHLAAQHLKTRLETRVEAALNRPVVWGKLRGGLTDWYSSGADYHFCR